MDGRIDCGTSSTSETAGLEEVILYPNPASDKLQIVGFEALGIEVGDVVEIRDMQGRLCSDVALRGGALDVSEWPTGLYILHMSGHRPVRFAVER